MVLETIFSIYVKPLINQEIRIYSVFMIVTAQYIVFFINCKLKTRLTKPPIYALFAYFFHQNIRVSGEKYSASYTSVALKKMLFKVK